MRTRAPGRVPCLVVTAALGLLVGACGSGAPTGTGTSTTAAPSTTVAPTTSQPAASTTSFRLYFMRGDKLAVSGRTVPATQAVGRAALDQLLAGPTPAEVATGLSTAIPAGSRLLGLSIANGVATADLNSTYESGGGSLSMTARLAEVTYTLSQFPTVTAVSFRLEGKPVSVFGGEGIILDHPSTRADFESVTPAILVESPTSGARVTSPLRVWGTANVFEAAFQLELTDGSGHVVASRPVRATSGTGTRGSFDITVPFSAAAGSADLRLFDLSAKDGSRQDLVSVALQVG